MGKGQASLEQLLITALMLTVVGVLFFMAMTYSADTLRAMQAKDAVDKMAKTADYVYSLGPGYKQSARLTFPDNTQLFNASGKRIWVSIPLSSGTEDVYANTRATVFGSLRSMTGTQDVQFISTYDGTVLIGQSTLVCSPGSLVKSFVQGGSGSDSIVISNAVDFTVNNISTTQFGNIADLLTITQPSASLASGAATSVGLMFSIPGNKTVGTYTGLLYINDSSGTQCPVAVTVRVTNPSGSDLIGPQITGTTTFPASPNPASIIIVNATASDLNLGNGTVSFCDLQIDASDIWNRMTGLPYGQITISSTYTVGNLGSGSHKFGIRCTDNNGNIGLISNTSISVT
jgi:uncharacterized protein (UPF0333 family)